MGILNDVLAYKERKEQQKRASLDAIPQAMVQFQAGQQQAFNNSLSALTLKASLAKSGLSFDKNGKIVSDVALGGTNLLDNALKAQRISTSASKERLYNQMLETENQQAEDPDQILEEASAKSGLGKEDFIVKPLTRMVAGVPHTSYVPEIKPPLPSGERKEFMQFGKLGLSLSNNLKMLKDHPEFAEEMSPTNIKAMRGDTILGKIGQLMLKLDPSAKDFATFKAQTDIAFQDFRKNTTGAQAALAELGWLAPDYPETTDNPDLYKAKATESLKRISEAEKLLKSYWSSQGFRTSEMSRIETPAEKSGKELDLTSMSEEELRKIANG